MRAAALLLVLSGTAAAHDETSFEGYGRAALGGGWRLTPNDFFRARAAEAGHPVEGSSPGGPQVSGAFCYAATDAIEACIDLFAGHERLRLERLGEVASWTYGGMFGARFFWADVPADRFVPYLGAHTGPTLVFTQTDAPGALERVAIGYAFTAGMSYRASPKVGVWAEYKLLLARGEVAHVASINGGGSWLTVGVVFYFPPSPSPIDRP